MVGLEFVIARSCLKTMPQTIARFARPLRKTQNDLFFSTFYAEWTIGDFNESSQSIWKDHLIIANSDDWLNGSRKTKCPFIKWSKLLAA